MKSENISKDILLGIAVGDALGVPVEFKKREIIALHPVEDMIGYGTYNLPPGTWSDDSSLTFCLSEVLSEDYNIHHISEKFVRWAFDNYWTPYGKVFDIGISTAEAISKLRSGIDPSLAGGNKEHENGNGSLMRILPLILHIKEMNVEERFVYIEQVSSLTHRHIRSLLSCFYYLEFAGKLIQGKNKFDVFTELQKEFPTYLRQLSIRVEEIYPFQRILNPFFHELSIQDINSDGYVIHTLEASIWCLLNGNDYRETVLKAVNLGYDTDTTAAVTGGLAGILYGYKSIPTNWINQLARLKEIEDLANRLEKKYKKSN